MTNVLQIPLDQLLDAVEYVPARWVYPVPGKKIMYIVLHSMEAPESENRALNTASYFKTVDRKASVQFTTDNKNVVRCAKDMEGVYGAAGTNRNGIHIEQPGYAAQSQAEWLEPYNLANFEQVGRLMAAINLRYGVPLEYVGVNGLRAGNPGVVTHWDCSRVYEPGGHTDPGLYYPMDRTISVARRHRDGGATQEEEDMPLNVGPISTTREADGVTLAALVFNKDIIMRWDKKEKGPWWMNDFVIMSNFLKGQKLPEDCHQPWIDMAADGRFQVHCIGIASGKHYIAYEALNPATPGVRNHEPVMWEGYASI